MKMQRHPWRAIAVTAFASLLVEGILAADAKFLTQDTSLIAFAPPAAFENPGCWVVDDRFVATGHSLSADSLGPGKDRRAERELAENDAKARIAREAARAQEPGFDQETHSVNAEISGFQTAGTYKLPGRDGFFLVGMVQRDAVHVRAVFEPARARGNARAAFEAGDYLRAARLFAALTQHGAQDAETAAFARAAGAHVNLAAGVTGSARADAIRMLADFHFQRGDDEEALRFSHLLYRDAPEPERALLERLAELSRRTHRQNNATAFRKEIARRWPESSKP